MLCVCVCVCVCVLLPPWVELSSKGITGFHSRNAKLFEWIEHFGRR